MCIYKMKSQDDRNYDIYPRSIKGTFLYNSDQLIEKHTTNCELNLIDFLREFQPLSDQFEKDWEVCMRIARASHHS